MPSFAELIQQGSTHAWLFIPSAILLGALHGLEPGHSKTMMAAFIVAVRGTVKQAVLLGLAATVSHTLIVWAIALGGLYLWRGVSAEALEPYRIDTGHGIVAVEVFEDGVPPRWRVRSERGHAWRASDVRVETERPDGRRQTFAFADRGGYLESIDEIPEPHEFMARVSLGLGGHSHDYDLAFVEGHGHDHIHEELRGLD
ncbi:MAG: HoxN/HupN/NixA family nickel/cobalt transporter, partial [Brevundimonas aurantiaca]|uniref:HoxN/HupN/NixA family nickel/cobalt transporter n=1 Tax=Brevundimonas aurantiaca TaxID=74316 RepID=UPI0040334DFD